MWLRIFTQCSTWDTSRREAARRRPMATRAGGRAYRPHPARHASDNRPNGLPPQPPPIVRMRHSGCWGAARGGRASGVHGRGTGRAGAARTKHTHRGNDYAAPDRPVHRTRHHARRSATCSPRHPLCRDPHVPAVHAARGPFGPVIGCMACNMPPRPARPPALPWASLGQKRLIIEIRSWRNQ